MIAPELECFGLPEAWPQLGKVRQGEGQQLRRVGDSCLTTLKDKFRIGCYHSENIQL